MHIGLVARLLVVAPVGGAAMHCWHTIKTYSTTQAIVAMSSGESELYSLAKGAAQTLGLIALAADLGLVRNERFMSTPMQLLELSTDKG